MVKCMKDVDGINKEHTLKVSYYIYFFWFLINQLFFHFHSGYNRRSIGIAFIGTFNKMKPPDRQIEACKLLIEDGVRLGVLDKDYKLYGHRQLLASESPGDELFSIIKKWPHWSDTPIVV